MLRYLDNFIKEKKIDLELIKKYKI